MILAQRQARRIGTEAWAYCGVFAVSVTIFARSMLMRGTAARVSSRSFRMRVFMVGKVMGCQWPTWASKPAWSSSRMATSRACTSLAAPSRLAVAQADGGWRVVGLVLD